MSQVSDPAGDVAIARADVSTHPQASFWTLTLGAIGVVYGDIGTSPLYAMREVGRRRGRRRQRRRANRPCSASCR